MSEPSGVTPVVRRSRPRPSKLYPVLWRFATERQRVYLRRLAGESPPWTDDPVLSAYRFTNAFRAADRVSQYLIRLAYADPLASDQTLLLRTLLFKIFNRIDTWEHIVRHLGPPVAFHFDYAACDELLGERLRAGAPIYSAAYIMPSGGRRGVPKHSMHLRLLRDMVTYGLAPRLMETKSLERAYTLLVGWRTLGPFLAFQYAIDLNYTPLLAHEEVLRRDRGLHPRRTHPLAHRAAGGGVRALRAALRRSLGPPAAADRRAEPAVRGLEVHSGHAPRDLINHTNPVRSDRITLEFGQGQNFCWPSDARPSADPCTRATPRLQFLSAA